MNVLQRRQALKPLFLGAHSAVEHAVGGVVGDADAVGADELGHIVEALAGAVLAMHLEGEGHVVFLKIGNERLEILGQHIVGKYFILAKVRLSGGGDDVLAAEAVRQRHIGAEVVQALRVHQIAVARHADERKAQRFGLFLNALDLRLRQFRHDVLRPVAHGGNLHMPEARFGDALQRVVHVETVVGVGVDGKNTVHGISSCCR